DAPGEVFVRAIGPTGDVDAPGGLDALAAPGDVLLANDRVVAVIEALDHPHYLEPSGGGLVDLATRGDDNDSLRNVLQVTGLLPEDAAHYTELRQLQGDGWAAVQVHGTLDGRPGVRVITRYEVHACEPGVRVRTELINEGTDPLSMLVGDGWYWGGRESLAFTPSPGSGFAHPSFGLSTVGAALRDTPYLVGAAHVAPAAAYASIGCNFKQLQGFHSEEVTLYGAPKRVIMPRDYEVFERFIAVAAGEGVSAAADIALEARRQLFDEPWTELSGQVVLPAGDPGQLSDSVRAQVVISEGSRAAAPEERTPWTHVVPEADGSWTARVPTDRTYTVEVEAFGQVVADAEVRVGTSAATAPPLEVPLAGALTVDVTIDGARDHALVFLRPTTDAEEDTLRGSFLGHFDACAPLVGHPFGSSPACDRLLVDGPTTFVVPPGEYQLMSVAGPFTTMGHATVTVAGGQETAATLALQTLDLQPAGTLSADLHVHSSMSFDASLGPADRVRSFLASRIQVLATTEHDVVSDFAPQVTAFGAQGRLAIIDGTESTGHILFPLFEDSPFPKVIGHFNFWPVPYDALGPYRGAPWDELAEPGALMDRMVARGWPAETGIAQLNHPWGGFQFGRDYGWADSIDVRLNEPLPTAYDGSGASLFLRTPPGASFSNADYHTQEVMNSSNNFVFTSYRAFWHYLMDQGVFRTGTANSDSHSLADNVLGFPRNLVWTDETVAGFDAARFNADLRAGRVLGTNGPILEVETTDASGAVVRPSLTPFTPGAGAALHITVRAAPWVPVDEVRVIVNSQVVRTITDLTDPADPFGASGVDRYDAEIPLSELLPASGDAWISVEAGRATEPTADLDCDGWPDTGDNNGDGTIDWRDVAELEDEPKDDCFDTVGPLKEPDKPGRGEPGYEFRVVVPDGYPTAFTNPLIVDRDGAGFVGVGR
ncbi:MAG TPA: CehA/McbA family metallohydrolase, partial [Myxococcota bacterium]|nr:CehA/McbA family metallohydrolase [Myxococcota bacterium]